MASYFDDERRRYGPHETEAERRRRLIDAELWFQQHALADFDAIADIKQNFSMGIRAELTESVGCTADLASHVAAAVEGQVVAFCDRALTNLREQLDRIDERLQKLRGF